MNFLLGPPIEDLAISQCFRDMIGEADISSYISTAISINAELASIGRTLPTVFQFFKAGTPSLTVTLPESSNREAFLKSVGSTMLVFSSSNAGFVMFSFESEVTYPDGPSRSLIIGICWNGGVMLEPFKFSEDDGRFVFDAATPALEESIITQALSDTLCITSSVKQKILTLPHVISFLSSRGFEVSVHPDFDITNESPSINVH